MGKEAKIGMGIIAILAIVLGVVVFRKVWGSKDMPKVSVETPAAGDGESDAGNSIDGGAMLTPAKDDTKAAGSGPFGGDVSPSRWGSASDRFIERQNSGTSGQPPTELMPKAGLDTQNSQDLRSGDRFGEGPLRQRSDFGTGRTNVLRSDPNDGALNSSSRRQYSDDGLHPADSTLGGLRPTTPARLQPGPDAIQAVARSSDTLQAVAQSSDTQAQYAAQQPASYGTGFYGALPRDATSDRAIASDSLLQNTGSYVVQPNDSFWSVSKKAYGSGDFYKALIEHNRKKFPDPSKLRVGDVIATPAESDLRKNYPVFCPKDRKSTRGPYRATALAQSRQQRIYVVQEGDTIFNIARDELGKTSRWAEICTLNHDLLGDDYDHLKPGWKLALPGSGSATGPAVDDGPEDSLTRQIWSRTR